MEGLIFVGMILGAMVLPVLFVGIQSIIVNILEYKYEVYKLAAEMKDEKANK